MLYLGAATGTTVSHVSDIVGNDGIIYAIEISERNLRNLIELCESRKNILPILADASDIKNYDGVVSECDVIYQGESAKNQADILLENSKLLKKGGYAYFVIKSQSIDISRSPKDVYKDELKKLEGTFELLESTSLDRMTACIYLLCLKRFRFIF